MTNQNGDDRNGFNWVNIRAKIPYEESDEALEALVQLKELEFGEIFTDRDTKLDADEDEGISIRFHHEDEFNLLSLAINDGNDINIQLILQGKYQDMFSSILNPIQESVENIIVSDFVKGRSFDTPFSGIDLPIVDESETEVIGIRVRIDELEYIIQELREGSSGTFILASYDDEISYQKFISEGFLDKVNSQMEAIAERGLK